MSISPEIFFYLSAVDACMGWLSGLLILIVGLVSARSALPRAGYLIGGAGALLIARWCCAYIPSAYARYSGEVTSTMHDVALLLSVAAYLAFAVLFLAGSVILARTAKAKAGAR